MIPSLSFIIAISIAPYFCAALSCGSVLSAHIKKSVRPTLTTQKSHFIRSPHEVYAGLVDRVSHFRGSKCGTKVKSRITSSFTVGSTTQRLLSKKTARMGDKAKPLAAYRWRLCSL